IHYSDGAVIDIAEGAIRGDGYSGGFFFSSGSLWTEPARFVRVGNYVYFKKGEDYNKEGVLVKASLDSPGEIEEPWIPPNAVRWENRDELMKELYDTKIVIGKEVN
ncbi:MAG: hypothetical protein HDT19_00545, partial [Oscillibacter sp.]|nr:hypothetical protein [Oscillibacter sp.]